MSSKKSGSVRIRKVAADNTPGDWTTVNLVILGEGTAQIDVSSLALTSTDRVQVELIEQSVVVSTPVVDPPSLGWTVPIRVFREPDGSYTTNYDASDWIVTGVGATYYLSPTGDDSNDGLTVGAPKKSLKTLVTALNSSPPTGGATINLAPGFYLGADGLDGLSINFDCNLICEGGQAIMAKVFTPTWSLSGTVSGLWTSPRGDANVRVIDTTDTVEGVAKLFRTVIEVSDVTPGTLFVGGSSIGIKTWDEREPDGDVYLLDSSVGAWRQTSARDLYFKNIVFWQGASPTITSHAAGGQYVLEGCGFHYASATSNGCEFSGTDLFDAVCITVNCKFLFNGSDGISYRDAARGFELGNIAQYNGWTNLATSDNGSTAHQNAIVVRVNGNYEFNADRCIHDIEAVKSWNVAITAGNTTNTETDAYDNFAFGVGASGGTDTTQMWLLDCVSTGAVADVVSRGTGAVVTIEGGTGLDERVTLDSGTITLV